MKLNLPNKLTILRILLIPVFMLISILEIPNESISRVIATAVFAITALTDMLDGMIARKYNLITDFGKFLDPLADKFMVFGAFLSILVSYSYDETFRKIFVVATGIVIFRELAVTSIRLVTANKEGIVIAANMLGKIKTVSQIVFVITVLMENVLFGEESMLFCTHNVLTYVTMAFMTVMTVWSGANYIKSYWKYIDPTK